MSASPLLALGTKSYWNQVFMCRFPFLWHRGTECRCKHALCVSPVKWFQALCTDALHGPRSPLLRRSLIKPGDIVHADAEVQCRRIVPSLYDPLAHYVGWPGVFCRVECQALAQLSGELPKRMTGVGCERCVHAISIDRFDVVDVHP